ncbi:MAG: dihydrolipoyl dehydrogenase [Gammaproteobacteria bacterium]|nr:dihydrolipoyl dehydrogenase [Gammaproteobacteria bacterium]
MNRTRIILIFLVIALIAAGAWLDIGQYLTLEEFRARQDALQALVDQNLSAAVLVYFLVYIAVAALNIPGAAVMTLVAGALFGLLLGTVVVSFASTIGATLAFLLSRYLLRDYVERRFSRAAERINNGIKQEGAYYLFTLRLVPLFPFFVINMAMALTRLKTATFAWVSQVGMLAGTVIYVNAGTQISRIESTADILSPGLLGSFILLGIFPLLAKKTMRIITMRRHRKKFKKPKRFDVNLVVIGAGSAGLVTAYIAAASKAKVVLIEKNRMGGDCLNTGCVPSKALIRSARIASYIKRAESFGLTVDNAGVDFPKVMRRVRDVIETIEPHDSVERYTNLGVDCIQGAAVIASPYSVSVNNQTISTRSIVIATGGGPLIPKIPGLDNMTSWTSDTIWNMSARPERLLILGGGPIGCEMAQAFQRLGSAVTLVEMAPRLLIREDPEVSEAIAARFIEEGINVLTNHTATNFETRDNRRLVHCSSAGEADGNTMEIEFDEVLVAVGRRADTKSLGLENLGIETKPNGTVAVNEYLQTAYPNVFACGDVAGPYQLTHAAAHQAWYCAMNALFGSVRKFRADYSVLPWAIFTDPEVARVGLSEEEAKAQGLEYEITRYGIDDLDRAIADSEASGFVKVLTPPGRDKILGVSIVGPHAGDLIAEFVSAMRNGLGLKKILNTIHIYPTLAEANRFAAGEWRKAHLSERLIDIARRYHQWMRG